MDEKTTTVANGNKDGKQERETRTVEVRVSTDNLGTMILKSLNSAEVCKAAGWKAPDIEDGGIPDQATVHFADSGRLQVFDSGRCILERDSLPTLDAYCLVEYAKVLHEHGEVTPDNFDRYEVFDEDEFPLYQSLVARAEGPEEEGGNAEWVRGFWKRVQTGKVPEKEGFMIGLLHHICDDLENYGPLWSDGMKPPAILATVEYGSRGGVSFQIEIPQNEPFDINKLHFFCSPWWWDSPLGVHGDIGYMLELCSDTSLELIEYDGKIYCRGEADRAGGGFKNILIHADLKEFEPDWNLDGCAFEDLGVEVEDDEDDAWDEDEEDYEEEEEEEDEDEEEEEEEAADGDE